MNRLVFLSEEPSIRTLLDGLLPRLFPGLRFLCVPHEGKQDLEKSVPRKLRAWQEPGVRFVVIRDNDGGDCRALKDHLLGLCEEGQRRDSLVRIACQELEAWYLGEPEALAEAFADPSLSTLHNKKRYRQPDEILKPSNVLETLIPAFQKISGARRMATKLTRDRNRSSSFQALISGIERMLEASPELLAEP